MYNKLTLCLDHDNIFWLGDLNYRIAGLDTNEVKDYLKENNLTELQNNDQFYQQRHQRKVFVGFKEGPITFPPTYKYDPGTNSWDSSEKARPPAWTDRILWQGDTIHQTNYRSHMDLLVTLLLSFFCKSHLNHILLSSEVFHFFISLILSVGINCKKIR